MAKPDLVLLPGWAMPPTVFSSLMPLLERRGWRVHRPALPVADNLPAMAAALLDAAPACAVWLGWSLGGMVAVQAACAQPARVAALVTVATNLRFIDAPDWSPAMPAADFHAFANRLAADPEGALARFAALVTHGAPAARADQRELRTRLAGCARDPHALRRTLRVLADADLRAVVEGLRCPSLWLYGEHDALVPAAVAATINGYVPQADTRVLAAASHLPFLSEPQRVADAIDRFFPEPA